MMAALQRRPLRQQRIEIALHRRRIVAAALPLGLGGVEHGFKPLAQLLGGLGLGDPERFEHGDDLLDRDLGDRAWSLAPRRAR